MKTPLAAVMLVSLAVPLLSAQDAVTAGAFHVERPTLANLGFDWKIEGDANRNAAVGVEYRESGTAEWKPALPLLRIGGERVYRQRENLEYIVPHAFAGSILNLKPGTEYECRFTMKDPDGVSGQAVRTVKARTRTAPVSYNGGRTLHVYPPDWKGARQEPSFTGLMQAYYGAGLGDWSVVRERNALPGDVILIHAGMYRSERLNYVDPLAAPFDGSYSLTLKGTAEKPITIRGAGDGEAIFDGDGCSRLFDVMASEHHIFEDLTIRNADYAFFAGQKDVLGARALTVRNCRLEDVGFGITTEYAGSEDFYIADNVILGRDNRFRLIGWSNPGIYGAHALRSYYGVKVYGRGHVVAHNAIAYFHDGIGISTYGTPDPARLATAIDIYNNDIHMMGDDFIETDGGVHNIRVMNNRGVNAAHGGMSAQPVFGGPVYFIRNIAYHVASGVAFKFSAKPAGLFVYHNTLISEHVIRDPHSNTHFRNNLFLGSDAPGRGILTLANATAYSSFDYDGYRPNRNGGSQFNWFAPAAPGERVYEPARSDWKSFTALAQLSQATGQEAHGMEVDYDIFEELKGPDGGKRHAVYHSMDLNFRLKPGARVVDAGLRLPTVNDDFAGRGPDLGALEVGRPEPVYGPRPGIKPPFYR
ncbi:MAG: hypothetical protein SFV51_03465 [Bryobacteraceae bacterium]|nr:hypothetical protein [Bryobacteraceae bacterium]